MSKGNIGMAKKPKVTGNNKVEKNKIKIRSKHLGTGSFNEKRKEVKIPG